MQASIFQSYAHSHLPWRVFVLAFPQPKIPLSRLSFFQLLGSQPISSDDPGQLAPIVLLPGLFVVHITTAGSLMCLGGALESGDLSVLLFLDSLYQR